MLRKRNRTLRAPLLFLCAMYAFCYITCNFSRSWTSKASTLDKYSALYKRFVILGDHSMKKSLLSLAALGAFAGVAHAQSSVTLYGIIDVGINMNTNAGGFHKYDMSSGVMQGSRFGLRGTEDLGGG